LREFQLGNPIGTFVREVWRRESGSVHFLIIIRSQWNERSFTGLVPVDTRDWRSFSRFSCWEPSLCNKQPLLLVYC